MNAGAQTITIFAVYGSATLFGDLIHGLAGNPTHFWSLTVTDVFSIVTASRVGISRTTAKSLKRKLVPSSHPGRFAVVASSRKKQTKIGSLAV